MQDKLAVFVFGAARMRVITVRLFHLPVMDIGHFQLRFGGFRHVGEERYEVLVFNLRLRQRRAAALVVPGVANAQLGAGNVLRIRVSIDQRLQREPGDVVLAMAHGVHGAVEEHFVGLLGIDVGERIFDFLVRERPNPGRGGCRSHYG